MTGVFAVIPFGAPLIYTFAALYMLSIGKTMGGIVINLLSAASSCLSRTISCGRC